MEPPDHTRPRNLVSDQRQWVGDRLDEVEFACLQGLVDQSLVSSWIRGRSLVTMRGVKPLVGPAPSGRGPARWQHGQLPSTSIFASSTLMFWSVGLPWGFTVMRDFSTPADSSSAAMLSPLALATDLAVAGFSSWA